MMQLIRVKRVYPLILLILLTACGSEAAAPAAVVPAPTETTSVLTNPAQATAEAPTPAPTFTATLLPEPTVTNTPLPTSTPPPADTPTSTPEPAPMVRVAEDSQVSINVRSGPGTAYPVLGQLDPGQAALVTGRNEAGGWWQINLVDEAQSEASGWIFGELVALEGNESQITVAEAPPPPTPEPPPVAAAEANDQADSSDDDDGDDPPPSPEELADQLRCGKDFCVTYQDMLSIGENGGCVGNHSIYITVLQGPPPGQPMDGVVIGDTFNNVEVASGSHGPGRTEITLWNNSMTLTAKRHIDGTPYTSEQSFNFTAADELIPAEVLAAKGYCDGRVETCRVAQQNNQVCRGHYSWRVTFHKFD